jgi:ariadne-1
MYHKFEEYSFNSFVQTHAADVSCCPTPDCKYVFVGSDESPHFLCPICERTFCLNCRCEFHDGVSCEEHKKLTDVDALDRMFERFVRGTNYKQCPQCKYWVEKVDGCDTMNCRCSFRFCYNCGVSVHECGCGQSYA